MTVPGSSSIPIGVKGDHQNGDDSYDPVWEGATNIDSLGWTAEFRIPLFAAEVLARYGSDLGNAGVAHDRPAE